MKSKNMRAVLLLTIVSAVVVGNVSGQNLKPTTTPIQPAQIVPSIAPPFTNHPPTGATIAPPFTNHPPVTTNRVG